MTSRSVASTSTEAFKLQFRHYLSDLADLKDIPDRQLLLQRLEGAFDAWEALRIKFFENTPQPLTYPFLTIFHSGRPFAQYEEINAFGAPSTISVKAGLLLGNKKVALGKIPATVACPTERKLTLQPITDETSEAAAAGHRLFLTQVLLHELIHQFLHEGAAPETAATYRETESGKKGYRGHGKLFAAECNRVGQIIHAEFGLDFVPVRNSKRDSATRADLLRPSCASWGIDDILFVWDHQLGMDLSDEQAVENEARLAVALSLFGGAITVEDVETKEEEGFLVSYAADAAETCINALSRFDTSHGTDLLQQFLAAAADHAAERTWLSKAAAVLCSGTEPAAPADAGQKFKFDVNWFVEGWVAEYGDSWAPGEEQRIAAAYEVPIAEVKAARQRAAELAGLATTEPAAPAEQEIGPSVSAIDAVERQLTAWVERRDQGLASCVEALLAERGGTWTATDEQNLVTVCEASLGRVRSALRRAAERAQLATA
jgi:hypothetical protein